MLSRKPKILCLAVIAWATALGVSWGAQPAIGAGQSDLAQSPGHSSKASQDQVHHQVAWQITDQRPNEVPDEEPNELKLLFSEDRKSDSSFPDRLNEGPGPIDQPNDSSEMETESIREGAGVVERGQQKSMTDSVRLSQRLASLRKPASSLTLAPGRFRTDESSKNDEPLNRAAAIMADEPTEFIEGSYQSIPRAKRVHVPFCHRPTYFQELNLERCGRPDCERFGCFQNAYSSFWFLTNAALLPYRIGSQSPHQCVGSYGDCPSCHQYDTPIEPLCAHASESEKCRGILLQAASMAGFAFLIW